MMNTCEDCIHYNSCDDEILCFASFCGRFKNKSDFVEVIKCKDCMHYSFTAFDSALNKNCGYCNINVVDWNDKCKEVFEDDFCSKATKI